MWVRSQGRDRLMDVDEFVIEHTAIWGFSKLREKGYVLLGQYGTDDKAMEVLNEIQKRLVLGISMILYATEGETYTKRYLICQRNKKALERACTNYFISF
jgi:hypothetical protein